MTSSRSLSNQLGPLHPGSVVSAALLLYRDRFKAYLKLSVIAHLWILAGIIVLSLFIVIGNYVSSSLGIVLGVCLGLLPAAYGIAKYLLLSALISRLTFKSIISKPEKTTDGQQAISPNLWSFFTLGILVPLFYLAAYIVALIVAVLTLLPVGMMSGMISVLTTPEFGAVIGFVLGAIVGFGAFIAVMLWAIARVLIAEVIIAIEGSNQPSRAISRNFRLTQNIVLRVMVVILAAALISLPITLITNYAFQIPILVLPQDSSVRTFLISVSYISSILGNILLLPFWQVLKGVLYYDLLSRREGLDLQLRNPKFKVDTLLS